MKDLIVEILVCFILSIISTSIFYLLEYITGWNWVDSFWKEIISGMVFFFIFFKIIDK